MVKRKSKSFLPTAGGAGAATPAPTASPPSPFQPPFQSLQPELLQRPTDRDDASPPALATTATCAYTAATSTDGPLDGYFRGHSPSGVHGASSHSLVDGVGGIGGGGGAAGRSLFPARPVRAISGSGCFTPVISQSHSPPSRPSLPLRGGCGTSSGSGLTLDGSMTEKTDAKGTQDKRVGSAVPTRLSSRCVSVSAPTAPASAGSSSTFSRSTLREAAAAHGAGGHAGGLSTPHTPQWVHRGQHEGSGDGSSVFVSMSRYQDPAAPAAPPLEPSTSGAHSPNHIPTAYGSTCTLQSGGGDSHRSDTPVGSGPPTPDSPPTHAAADGTGRTAPLRPPPVLIGAAGNPCDADEFATAFFAPTDAATVDGRGGPSSSVARPTDTHKTTSKADVRRSPVATARSSPSAHHKARLSTSPSLGETLRELFSPAKFLLRRWYRGRYETYSSDDDNDADRDEDDTAMRESLLLGTGPDRPHAPDHDHGRDSPSLGAGGRESPANGCVSPRIPSRKATANGTTTASIGSDLRGYEARHHRHWSVFTPDGIDRARPAVCHYLHLGRWCTLTCDYFLHRFPEAGETRGHTVLWLHNAKPRDRFVFLISPVEAVPETTLISMFWKVVFGIPPLFALSQGRVRWNAAAPPPPPQSDCAAAGTSTAAREDSFASPNAEAPYTHESPRLYARASPPLPPHLTPLKRPCDAAGGPQHGQSHGPGLGSTLVESDGSRNTSFAGLSASNVGDGRKFGEQRPRTASTATHVRPSHNNSSTTTPPPQSTAPPEPARHYGVAAVEVLHSDITALDFSASLATSRLSIEGRHVTCRWFASKEAALRHFECSHWLRYFADVRSGGAGAVAMEERVRRERAAAAAAAAAGGSDQRSVPSGSFDRTYGTMAGSDVGRAFGSMSPPLSRQPSAANRADSTQVLGECSSRQSTQQFLVSRSNSTAFGPPPPLPLPPANDVELGQTSSDGFATSRVCDEKTTATSTSSPTAGPAFHGRQCGAVTSTHSDTIVVLYSQDPAFRDVLREVVMPEQGTFPYTKTLEEQRRLLGLVEAGMPSWAIFVGRWGLPYRRYLRLIVVGAVNIWPLIGLFVGLYDLYKHMPYVRGFLADNWLFEWINDNFALRSSLIVTYFLTVLLGVTQSVHSLGKTLIAFVNFVAAPLQPVLALWRVLLGPLFGLLLLLQGTIWAILAPVQLLLTTILAVVTLPMQIARAFSTAYGTAASGVQTVGRFALMWRTWMEFWNNVARPIKNMMKATYDGIVHVGVAISKRDTSLRRGYRHVAALCHTLVTTLLLHHIAAAAMTVLRGAVRGVGLLCEGAANAREVVLVNASIVHQLWPWVIPAAIVCGTMAASVLLHWIVLWELSDESIVYEAP